MLGKRKDTFTGEASNPGEKVDSYLKEPTPLVHQEEELLKGNFKGAQAGVGVYM